MRNWILLSMMVFEAFLLIYCLVRKSNHVPAGYLCAFLSLLLLIVTGWLLLFPKVEPLVATGDYQVLHKTDYYIDHQRVETYSEDGSYRELPVAFWYPKEYSNGQSCPLVVFSHGSFGMKESNETLFRELASQGYIVCSIDHTYQCFSTTLFNGKKVRLSSQFMKEVSMDKPNKKPKQSLVNFEKWMKIRTDDLNFVLDTLLEKSEKKEATNTFLNLIDSSQICVMGHSLGGSAALGIGRQRKDISAVISLEAPFLCDIQGVSDDNEFIFDQSEFPVPVLNIYSDATWEHLNEWKQYEENARLLERESSRVQNIHFSGIGHFSLTDLSLTSPFLTSVFDGTKPQKGAEITLRKINDVCLKFLDQQLKKKETN